MSLRLLQHRAQDGTRSLIAAQDDGAVVVKGVATMRELATRAIALGTDLLGALEACGIADGVRIDLELAAGRILAPIDHEDPAHLMMSGTGLTHLGSAESRDKMHQTQAAAALTDSMRIFQEGLTGGKPSAGQTGVQPEWFYKGDGSSLVHPEQALILPSYAQDGGEEPELAGIYLIGPDGTPFRLGICLANEFSDHVTERHNYLWLAHSKLRQAALGPELLVGTPPAHVAGVSRIHRGNAVLWEKPFVSGERNMSHSLANLEFHHFKYPQFRRPGDVHVHFFGTATLSYSDGVRTQAGDVFEIEASPFTLPLRNRLEAAPAENVRIRTL